MHISLTKSQNVRDELKWDSVETNVGNLYDNSTNRVRTTLSVPYFNALTFRGADCNLGSQLAEIQLISRTNDVSSRSAITATLNNTLLSQHWSQACVIQSTKEGKQAAWLAFPLTFGNYFYAYTTEAAFRPVPFFKYKTINPVRGFNAIYPDTISAKKSGLYYINIGLKITDFKYDFYMTLNGQFITYSRIKRSIRGNGYIAKSVGFIQKLEPFDQLKLVNKEESMVYSSSWGKSSYILGFELDTTAPYFMAYESDKKCTANSTTFEQLSFKDIVHDNLNSWNSETNSFKATRPGFYYVDYTVPVQRLRTLKADLLINGETFMTIEEFANERHFDTTVFSRSGLVELKAFDEISIKFSGCIENDVRKTIFNIFYVPK